MLNHFHKFKTVQIGLKIPDPLMAGTYFYRNPHSYLMTVLIGLKVPDPLMAGNMIAFNRVKCP